MEQTQTATAEEPDGGTSLGSRVASGTKWSMVGNMVVRAGTLITGILVANLVGNTGIGIFAVAMTVGQMLLIFIDLGLGADLVRSSDAEAERKAPTTATLGLAFCTIGALALFLLAQPIANLLGSPASAQLLRVYSIMVFIGGLAIVPQSTLTRRLDQRSLFMATVGGFIGNTAVTFTLLLATGIGVLALPIGAVSGMALEVSMFYLLARRRPKFGWDREVVGPALRFGAPVAGSNTLQVLLGNIDKLVVAPVLGATNLGNYTMAANVSNWPVSVFGVVVRSVALPAFAQSRPRPRDPVLTLAAQVFTVVVAAMPIFLFAMHKTGGSIIDIARSLVPATLACIPAALVSLALSRLVDSLHLTGNLRLDSMIGLAVGGLTFLAIYVPLVQGRVRRSIAAMRTPAPQEAAEELTV